MHRGLSGSTPVALISNVSLPTMRKLHTTLEKLPYLAQEVGAPALIMLGEVLRAQIEEYPDLSIPLKAVNE
jgi:siroheme synthase